VKAGHDHIIKGQVGHDEAVALARTYDKVIAGRAKKTVTFDMKKNAPDDATLAAHILGPTGNLRAPSIRKGKTLMVGFSEEAYRQLLGVQ
jgi:hypothetical protein